MEREMSYFQRFGPLPLLGMAVVLCITGCPQSQNEVAASTSQAVAQDQSSDPAAVNFATDSTDASSQAPAAYQDKQSASAPATYSAQQSPLPANDNSYQSSEDPGYGQQPVSYAPQAPPPLPDYDQPPAPGDDYLWTPGYWAWGTDGYYWVPGGWVEAPYQGALWTPGYWGFYNNRYGFYGGYWGPAHRLLRRH